MKPRELIQLYLVGEISESQTLELNDALASDPELRREFGISAAMDAGLREIAFERVLSEEHPNNPSQPTPSRTSPWIPVALAALAATLVVMAGLAMYSPTSNQSSVVATLASSENAAWESALPTTAGSELRTGSLKLMSGIGTIRFQSGAEVMLEAPAELELITPMKGKLINGAAVVSVPEPAIGFMLETPDGYVVDHGTQFAVSVSGKRGVSDFEVIEGEISVHLPSGGEEVRLTDQQSASISQQQLTSFDGQLPERTSEPSPRTIRVGTNGRATSVIRNNKRRKRDFPELLMVKRGDNPNWDMRAFFSFDVSEIDVASMESVRLRLNLVPSGIGFASRLPKMSLLKVYGLTNDAKRDWVIESTWEDGPGPEDGELLGEFEVPRSVARGAFGIATPKLLNFVKQHQKLPITILVVRETKQDKGTAGGPVLVHAFASDLHAEAAGPVLEFSVEKNTNLQR